MCPLDHSDRDAGDVGLPHPSGLPGIVVGTPGLLLMAAVAVVAGSTTLSSVAPPTPHETLMKWVPR
jgi:hypothetical protein